MDWTILKDNWQTIALCVFGLASLIASATPTEKDDAFIAKIVNLLGLNLDRIKGKK